MHVLATDSFLHIQHVETNTSINVEPRLSF